MFIRLIRSFAGIKDNVWTYFVYEVLSVLLTSFLWVPVYTYIYKMTLYWMGFDALINSKTLTVVFSYKGILGISAIFILSLMIIFIQIGLLVIITQKSYFRKKVTLVDALIFVVKRVPKLFRLGILLILPFFLLFILLRQSALLNVFTGKYNVQIYLANQKPVSGIQLYLYCIIFVTLLYLLLRSVFAIHFIILKGQGTTKAIRSSFQFTRKKEMLTLLYLVLMNALILLLGFGIMYGVTWLIKLAVASITNPLISNFLLTLSSYLLHLLMLLVFPINLLFVTNLYYSYSGLPAAPEDDVIVRSHRRLSGIESGTERFFAKNKILLVLITAVYLTVTFLGNYAFSQQLFNWDIHVASHRGDSQAPENSLSGIREALAKGVQGVEIDVQMTKDGVIVLNHDDNLKRAAGVDKKVSDLTFAEVRQLEIGSSLGLTGERIPTLDEAIQEVKGKGFLIIDIKSKSNLDDIAQKIVDLIISNNMQSDTYVQSFYPPALKAVRNVNPDIRIGQILTALTGDLSVLDVDFYTINQNMVSDEFITSAHKLGRGVWVWTVNSDRNIREIIKYPVDGIISDNPERVMELMAE